jgi:hypothetical protein
MERLIAKGGRVSVTLRILPGGVGAAFRRRRLGASTHRTTESNVSNVMWITRYVPFVEALRPANSRNVIQHILYLAVLSATRCSVSTS